MDPSFSIILYNQKKHWMFFSEGEPHPLSQADLEKMDVILKSKIEEYNTSEIIKFEKRKKDFPHLDFKLSDYTIQLSEYKRQYLAVKTKTGESWVFVQCLCRVEHKNWEEEMIHVQDGGKCYFDLTINLSTNAVLSFIVNGEA